MLFKVNPFIDLQLIALHDNSFFVFFFIFRWIDTRSSLVVNNFHSDSRLEIDRTQNAHTNSFFFIVALWRSSMMAFEGEISQKKLFLIVGTRWVVLKAIVLLIKKYFVNYAIRQIFMSWDINQLRFLIPAHLLPLGH